MVEKPIITLTTDYGLQDSFVGMMKGVILGINPHAQVIDITHNIERHNIVQAAHVIGMSYKYFPSASIHVAVVDPGVGSQRRPILVITENHYFIGPDNGIFTPIFEKEYNNFFKVIHITSSHYFLAMTGVTFHGRDIFAPSAAWLSKGKESSKFGEPITDYVQLQLAKPSITPDKVIHGEVVTLDHFGNAITNITIEHISQLAPADHPKDKFRILCKDKTMPFVTYYSEAGDQSIAATLNGFSNLELFINQGNAAEFLGIKTGEPVSVRLAD